jgi:hypothetical protein
LQFPKTTAIDLFLIFVYRWSPDVLFCPLFTRFEAIIMDALHESQEHQSAELKRMLEHSLLLVRFDSTHSIPEASVASDLPQYISL